MALTCSIAKNVPGDQVMLKIPHEFRSAVDRRKLRAGPYIVIAYPAMRSSSSSIVDSKAISRALAKVEGVPGIIVAVAHAFTDEARELLDNRGAIHFKQHDFPWTDASLASVRSKKRR